MKPRCTPEFFRLRYAIAKIAFITARIIASLDLFKCKCYTTNVCKNVNNVETDGFILHHSHVLSKRTKNNTSSSVRLFSVRKLGGTLCNSFTVLVYTNSDNRGFCKDKNLAKKLVIRFLWFLYVYIYIPRLQEITHSHELTKINFYIFRGREFLVEWSPLHPLCGVTDQLHVTGAVR